MTHNDTVNVFCSLAASVATMAAQAVISQGEDPNSRQQIPKEAVVVLSATEGYDVSGELKLVEEGGRLEIVGRVTGLSPGKHGFHIHEFGDLRDPAGKSAGGHYNPEGVRHGGPDDSQHHAGDLGNIVANEAGVANVRVSSPDLKLHFVIGRALVVHDGEDDFKSQPSGDAGDRAALGVIGFAQVEGSQAE